MEKPINPKPPAARPFRPYTFDVAMKEAARKARAAHPPIKSMLGDRRG